MRKLLRAHATILFIFVAFASFGQGGWVRPNTNYGTRAYRNALDSTFLFPARNGTPSGVAALRSYSFGLPGLVGDTANKKAFLFWPKDSTWSEINTGINAADTVQWAVDSTVNAPPVGTPINSKVRVGTSPSGVFIGHANQIATSNGVGSFTYQTASAGDLLYDTKADATYKLIGGVWVLQSKLTIHNNLDKYGIPINIGSSDLQPFIIKTNGIVRERITAVGAIQFNNSYYFPTSDGAANTALTTNGSGTLSYVLHDLQKVTDNGAQTTNNIDIYGIGARISTSNFGAGEARLETNGSLGGRLMLFNSDNFYSELRNNGNLQNNINHTPDTSGVLAVSINGNHFADNKGNIDISDLLGGVETLDNVYAQGPVGGGGAYESIIERNVNVFATSATGSALDRNLQEYWNNRTIDENNITIVGRTGIDINDANLKGLSTTTTSNAWYMTSPNGTLIDDGITVTHNGSSVLELTSTTKGFLPPKMTTTQRDAIASPTDGMIISNITTHAINWYNGTSWQALGTGTGTVTSVSGTASRITSTGGTTPVIDISATFEGLLLKKADNLSGLGSTATSRTNLGATTVGNNLFTLTNPSAITFPRINADNTVDALSASSFRTAIGAGTGAGDALVANPLSQFASTTSAQLASVISDELGSGKAIFSAGTLDVASGKTLTNSNTLTLTATDGSTLAIGTGGTLGTAAYTAASAYEVPLTISTGLTRTTNTVTNDVVTGKAGSNTWNGGTAANESATIRGTTNATKTTSYVLLQDNGGLVGIGNTAPGSLLQINKDANSVTQADANGIIMANATAAIAGTQSISPPIIWQGNGWRTTSTAASRDVRFRADMLPVQGSGNPSGTWRLASSINGGAYVNQLTLTSGGDLTVTGGIVGTATNNAATAGNVGEEVNSTISTYTNFTTTATYQNVTSISLTAGDWDISAFFTYSSNSATITAASNAIFVISTTTASAAGAVEGQNISYVPQAALLGTSKFTDVIGPYRVSLSGTTTYYLNGQATFTLGNPQYVGSIRARRIR